MPLLKGGKQEEGLSVEENEVSSTSLKHVELWCLYRHPQPCAWYIAGVQ